MTEQPVGARQVAEYMGKSAYTIREWAKAGYIPARKVDGTKEWVFYLSEIREHFAGQKADPWARKPRRRVA